MATQGERMRQAVAEADQAVREREAAEQELVRVNDRTRKLLRKLNLTNRYGQFLQSVLHVYSSLTIVCARRGHFYEAKHTSGETLWI